MSEGPQIDIGIPSAARAEIAHGLSRLLADSYLQYVKTHGLHWSVTGSISNPLHQMFMLKYTELWDALDEVGERIRALDVMAPARYAQFAKRSSVTEETSVPSAEGMLRALVAGHEAVARTARSVFPLADRADDQPTIDLLTQRLLVHEKTAWMPRSTLA